MASLPVVLTSDPGRTFTDPKTMLVIVAEQVIAAVADPKMKARLADLGGTGLAGSPTDFGKLIADETEKWGKVTRAANIMAE
jgi:hypothetical protein